MPKTRAVGGWFNPAEQERRIGAVYPEESPFAFLANFKAQDAFDVVLFVLGTTFAHKNPGW